MRLVGMTEPSTDADDSEAPKQQRGARPDGGIIGGGHAEPTVLVSAGDIGLRRSVAVEILTASIRSEDRLIAITAGRPPTKTVQQLPDAVPSLDRSRLAILDESTGSSDAAALVRQVSPDVDPSNLAQIIEETYETMDSGDSGKTHLSVADMASTWGGTNLEATYNRAHEVAMTVGRYPGVSLFAIDSSGVPEQFLERLTHLYDVHLRVREENGKREASWTALTSESNGWRALSDVSLTG